MAEHCDLYPNQYHYHYSREPIHCKRNLYPHLFNRKLPIQKRFQIWFISLLDSGMVTERPDKVSRLSVADGIVFLLKKLNGAVFFIYYTL